MPTRRYMINPEEAAYQVTQAVGAATVTKAIELTVDFGALAGYTPTMTGTQAKLQVLQAIDKLRDHIDQKFLWPPA